MARLDIRSNLIPEAGVFPDRVANQITAATAPSVGGQECMVMADGGTDEGFQGSFNVPAFSGTPTIVAKGILDGSPGASDTLGFGFRKRASADGESADATFDAEQTVSSTIGSSGSGHADEDAIELSITLTGGDYAEGDEVYFYFFVDTSGTTYTGNFLLTGLYFDHTPA